jgi:kynurenine formamidase
LIAQTLFTASSEHVGTHFDAPAHWITGRHLPRNTVDTIDVQNFIAPVAVVDASPQVADNEDWLLTIDFLQHWEDRHGRIPAGGWLAFRTDWSKRLADPASFVNMKEDGAHTPGPTQMSTAQQILRVSFFWRGFPLVSPASVQVV